MGWKLADTVRIPRGAVVVRRNPRKTTWVTRLRWVVQIGFLVFILTRTVLRELLPDSAIASIDAICPFGGVITLGNLLTAGRYLPKTHQSNAVLAVGFVLATLVSGGVFCGWICPFGTIQDWLKNLRRRLRMREIIVPAKADRVLRYGRYVVLAAVLYFSYSTGKLWFSSYDPYRTILGLRFVFEPSLEEWIGYAIAAVVIVASFLVERAWCKYACPFGPIVQILQRLSLLKIRRDARICTNCRICDKACPMGIKVSSLPTPSYGSCTNCLACTEACPKVGALAVSGAIYLPIGGARETEVQEA